MGRFGRGPAQAAEQQGEGREGGPRIGASSPRPQTPACPNALPSLAPERCGRNPSRRTCSCLLPPQQPTPPGPQLQAARLTRQKASGPSLLPDHRGRICLLSRKTISLGTKASISLSEEGGVPKSLFLSAEGPSQWPWGPALGSPLHGNTHRPRDSSEPQCFPPE